MDKVIKKVESKSLSGDEVLKLCNNKANLLTYTQLLEFDDIDDAMGKHGALILLFETKPNYGHWTCVFRANKDSIEFFDPYGIKPDDEMKWCGKYMASICGRVVSHLSLLLYNSKYKNIYYNHGKLQKYIKNVNTCGRWVALRLAFRKLRLEPFIKLFTKNKKMNADWLVTALTSFL